LRQSRREDFFSESLKKMPFGLLGQVPALVREALFNPDLRRTASKPHRMAFGGDEKDFFFAFWGLINMVLG
jgi:hypothetical protein